MKKIVGLFGTVALLFCLLGCGGKAENDDPEAVFAVSEVLAADSIAVHEVISPVALHVVDGHMIVTSTQTDTIFYVYSLPEFHYLYGSVVKGEGPQDIAYAGSVQYSVSADGLRFVADMRYQRMARIYSLSGEAMRWADTLVHPSKYSLKGVMGAGGGLLGIRHRDNSGAFLIAASGDSLSVMTDSVKIRLVCFPIQGNATLIVNSGILAVSQDAVALVYPSIPRAEFYRLDGEGKLRRLAAWGDSLYTRTASDFSGDKWFAVLEDDISYYRDVMASGAHFYAVYRGQSESQYNENPYNIIRVFDRQGRPVKSFRVDGTYELFAVDEPHGIIYAVDGTKDFDFIYTFKYELEE